MHIVFRSFGRSLFLFQSHLKRLSTSAFARCCGSAFSIHAFVVFFVFSVFLPSMFNVMVVSDDRTAHRCMKGKERRRRRKKNAHKSLSILFFFCFVRFINFMRRIINKWLMTANDDDYERCAPVSLLTMACANEFLFLCSFGCCFSLRE